MNKTKQEVALELLKKHNTWSKYQADYYTVIFYTEQWVIMKSKDGKESTWRLGNDATTHFLDRFEPNE